MPARSGSQTKLSVLAGHFRILRHPDGNNKPKDQLLFQLLVQGGSPAGHAFNNLRVVDSSAASDDGPCQAQSTMFTR